MTPQQLHDAANRLPRARLGHFPTPLEEAPRFSKALGDVRVFLKRDDCTGLLLGGNKTRHNEFVLGDAVAQGCDLVVWGASVQSNNCRQTAAACAKLGLECHLHLNGKEPASPQGNLLLDHLVGAKIAFTDAKLGLELDAYLMAKAEEERAKGRKVYVWDRARVLPRATVSYADCMAEIAVQLSAMNVQPEALYVSSAGSTGAGVALGKKLLHANYAVRIISPMHWPWNIPDDLAKHANSAAELLGSPVRLEGHEIDVDLNHIGPGYGEPSKEGREALKLLATTEGVLVDPIYSAKALAALIADVRAGRYANGSSLVFLHTGGVPAIFAETNNVL